MDSLPQDIPPPILCHIVKQEDFDGYGFNLHADRGKAGQYIGQVDVNSPAEKAHVKKNYIVIEVNGVNVCGNSHAEVVEKIRDNPDETTLLLVDPSAFAYYRTHNIKIDSTSPNVEIYSSVSSSRDIPKEEVVAEVEAAPVTEVEAVPVTEVEIASDQVEFEESATSFTVVEQSINDSEEPVPYSDDCVKGDVDVEYVGEQPHPIVDEVHTESEVSQSIISEPPAVDMHITEVSSEAIIQQEVISSEESVKPVEVAENEVVENSVVTPPSPTLPHTDVVAAPPPTETSEPIVEPPKENNSKTTAKPFLAESAAEARQRLHKKKDVRLQGGDIRSKFEALEML